MGSGYKPQKRTTWPIWYKSPEELGADPDAAVERPRAPGDFENEKDSRR